MVGRVFPATRLALGQALGLWVPRGNQVPNTTNEQAPLWGPAPLWQPQAALQQWGWQKSAAGTTLQVVGAAAPTVEGTPTSVQGDSGNYLLFSSAAVINSDAGIISPASFLQTRWDPAVSFSFFPNTAVTSVRYWVGLFSADPMAAAAPVVHMAGFRFDTSTADATWKCYTNNGAGAPTLATALVTPTAPVANVRQNLFLVFTNAGTRVQFWHSTGKLENGSVPDLIAETNVDMPTTSTSLDIYCQCRCLTAASRGLGISRVGGFCA